MANLALVCVLTAALLYIVFFVYLPYQTNSGKIVTVPDFRGMTSEEAIEDLRERNLTCEIYADSGYSVILPSHTILEQYPRALSKVKINRKIYFKLNARIPPLITFPDLSGSSPELARKQISNLQLVLDSIIYRPDIAVNTVIDCLYNGHSITAGSKIRKGSKIKIIVGTL